jgi:hypothetical protein
MAVWDCRTLTTTHKEDIKRVEDGGGGLSHGGTKDEEHNTYDQIAILLCHI